MKFQIDEKNIENEFERIAAQILLEKVLVVNDVHFNFTEIEFYYYSKNHQDAFTHKHSEPAGKWRFHNQGFDITLRGENGFGGILIRGVERVSTEGNTYINGPRRVLFSIMKNLNEVGNLNNNFGITDKRKDHLTIFRTFRQGLNNAIPSLACERTDYFKNKDYRFIVNPQSFDKKQFSGSEMIAKKFNNKDLSKEFLGYVLN
ncbi:hypothetical protein [Cyclobacterium qasimii]|uniref:Uncharacterized protein n=2 Tax=Cyclobacterium qasimii TaxID=1350429 RepID=S7VNB0_9BACT|nr:hypothetical protein [Cyclobacterium qasimii]EPR71675.1 hypothetical protein ADICYQ_0146 [Cyclobacterium qasimii M12-11B]GEO22419.1 hypothetical protein CQA01_29530 [Cyclobacterium qasimii]